MHVLSVRNILLLDVPWKNIWMFTAVNTSALNVESVSVAVMFYQFTGTAILERNRLNVPFVANDLHNQVALLLTAEFTVERNHTHVMSVTRHLVGVEILPLTWESTREKNRTSVRCVTKVSVTLATCRNINFLCTARDDLMTHHCRNLFQTSSHQWRIQGGVRLPPTIDWMHLETSEKHNTLFDFFR